MFVLVAEKLPASRLECLTGNRIQLVNVKLMSCTEMLAFGNKSLAIGVSSVIQIAKVHLRLGRAKLNDCRAILSRHGITGLSLHWCGVDVSGDSLNSVLIAVLLRGRLVGSRECADLISSKCFILLFAWYKTSKIH